ncbi:MAG: hypothetical protein ACP5JH_11480 [Bacteroidota bacterium]
MLLIKLVCFDLKILQREEKLLITILATPFLVVGVNILLGKVANFAFESGLPFVFGNTLMWGILFQALYTGHGLRLSTAVLFPLSSIEIVTVKNVSSICTLMLSNFWVSVFTCGYLHLTAENMLSTLLFSVYLPIIVVEVCNLLGFWIGDPSYHAELWLLLYALLLSIATGIFVLLQTRNLWLVVALTGVTACAFWVSLRLWAFMFSKKKFWLLEEWRRGR